MGRRGRLARAIFSAKECVFKAQYPLTGSMLGFDAFGIDLKLAAGTFTATALQPIPPLEEGQRLEGLVVCAEAVLATIVQVRHG